MEAISAESELLEVLAGTRLDTSVAMSSVHDLNHEKILATTFSEDPYLHSNNDTGLAFGSGKLLGVYGTSDVESFDTTVLREARAAVDEAVAEEVTATPTVTPTATPEDAGARLSATSIALISVGSIAFLAVLVALYVWWRRRRGAGRSPA